MTQGIILKWLRENPGWHSTGEIATGTGLAQSRVTLTLKRCGKRLWKAKLERKQSPYHRLASLWRVVKE